jgi:hypothetical protein
MKWHKRHRLWIAGVVALTLLSFLAATSLACFQMGAVSVKMAEDCCQGHCQHVMAADMAAQCCQNHQTAVSQALPASSSVKAAALVAPTLPVALILPAALQVLEQAWVCFSSEERPPPFPPLYTLHCALLI